MNTEAESQLTLAYEVSDEVLEGAAMVNGATKNYTLTFCSTPWTCPMSPQMMKQIVGGEPSNGPTGKPRSASTAP